MSDNVVSNTFESPMCMAQVKVVSDITMPMPIYLCERERGHEGNHLCSVSGFAGDTDLPKAPVKVAIVWSDEDFYTSIA